MLSSPTCSYLALPCSNPVISGFTPVDLSMHQHSGEPADDDWPRTLGQTGKPLIRTRAPKRPRQLGTPPPTTKRPRIGPCPKHSPEAKSSNYSNKGIARVLRVTKALKPTSIEKEAKQLTEVSLSTRLSEHTLSTLAAFKYRAEAAKDVYDVQNSEILEFKTSAAGSPYGAEGNVINTTDSISVYHSPGTLESELGAHTRTHAVSSVECLPSTEAVHYRSTGSACQTRIDLSPNIPVDENKYHSDTLSSSGNESFDRAVAKILTGVQKMEANPSASRKYHLQDQGCYNDTNEVTRDSRSYNDFTGENEISNGRDEQLFTEALFEHKVTSKTSPSMLLGYGEYDEYSDEFPTENLGNQALPHANDVQESFEPPSSIQLSYDDHDQRSEIYNPNMQRLSPHSEGTFPSLQIGEEMFPIGQQTTVNALRSSGRLSSAYEDTSSNTMNENGMENDYDEDFLDSEDVFKEEEDFLNDELDAGVLDLVDKVSKQSCQSLLAPFNDEHTTPKLQWKAPQLYKSTRSSPISSNVHESSPVQKTLVPTIIKLHPEAERNATLAKHLVAFDPNGKALPFARPAFPALIQDRSPIFGLSSSSCLRTCFRIGEALNAATIASHTNMHHLTELYARVTYSKRDGVEQFFQFADLFRPERPPYLNGSYIGWKGSDLWETGTKSFLVDLRGGKIARCIGKMKRDETTKLWKMVVLSIWEATWDDVGYVKGVVCA